MTKETTEAVPIPAPSDPEARTNRTGLAALLASAIVLIGLLPEILAIIDAEMGEHLPPGLRAWLVAAAAATTGLAMAITRIMAIPGVNAWLSRWSPFGTVPRRVARGKYPAK